MCRKTTHFGTRGGEWPPHQSGGKSRQLTKLQKTVNLEFLGCVENPRFFGRVRCLLGCAPPTQVRQGHKCVRCAGSMQANDARRHCDADTIVGKIISAVIGLHGTFRCAEK